jgi:hypothetical protein
METGDESPSTTTPPPAMTTAELAKIEAQMKALGARANRELDQRLARCAAELGYKPTGNPDCPYA